MSQREIYRTYKRSKGFSDYADAGSNPTDWTREDGHCWWCYQPVKPSVHDFSACREAMFVTVTQYRRTPKVTVPAEPSHPSLFESVPVSEDT